MWQARIINFPPSLIYYLRLSSDKVNILHFASVELPLKFHRQEHSLSCEAATLKMVLDYHGVNLSESEITNKIPTDPTLRSGNIWGNPHFGFVGNIDGKMMVDGYGVYWEPIAVAASNWKSAKIIKNGTIQDLTKHISEGRPVIVWGYLGRGRLVSWNTPDGDIVKGVDGEHTRVVYGFKGSVDDPDGFLVMDPIYGPEYWQTNKFLKNWEAFGRVGVVVYP